MEARMRHNALEIKMALKEMSNRQTRYHEVALDALNYIRQLEGDLRRAGFTEYNDPKEKETEE